MKIISLFLVLLLSVSNCSQSNLDDPKFEYVKSTRGHYTKVIVTKDKILKIKDREMQDVEELPISKSEWKSLIKAASKVQLQDIETIKSTSNKHQVDAALAAHLTVVVNDSTYQTTVFDHGAPPDEIRTVVQKILKYSNLKD